MSFVNSVANGASGKHQEILKQILAIKCLNNGLGKSSGDGSEYHGKDNLKKRLEHDLVEKGRAMAPFVNIKNPPRHILSIRKEFDGLFKMHVVLLDLEAGRPLKDSQIHFMKKYSSEFVDGLFYDDAISLLRGVYDRTGLQEKKGNKDKTLKKMQIMKDIDPSLENAQLLGAINIKWEDTKEHNFACEMVRAHIRKLPECRKLASLMGDLTKSLTARSTHGSSRSER